MTPPPTPTPLVVNSVVFSPPIPPPTPEDDHGETHYGEDSLTVLLRLTYSFAEREYESLLDNYLTLTDAEFDELRTALNDAHAERSKRAANP